MFFPVVKDYFSLVREIFAYNCVKSLQTTPKI